MVMQSNYPLSGDVAQWLRATGWSQIVSAWSQQNGIININNMSSGDEGAEQKILESVASYGRQLGWILEGVDVLIHKLQKSKCLGELTEDEEDKLEQVKTLKHRIEDAKKKALV